MIRIYLIVAFALLTLGACSGSRGAPVTSQEGAPALTTELKSEELAWYESEEHGIVVGYPAGWAITGDELSVYIAPDEEKFLWGSNHTSSDPRYNLSARGSYTNRGNRRAFIPESAAAVAQDYVDKMSHQVIEPVTSVDVNGHDGATALAGNEYYHRYLVVVRVTAYKAVVMVAAGPAEHSEEMQSILNAVALSLHPLEDGQG